MTHPIDVRIHRYPLLPEPLRQHHVCRLTPHATQALQSSYALRHCASVALHKRHSHLFQGVRLRIGVAHALYMFVYLPFGRLCHSLRRWERKKKARRHLVYPRVGTLTGEHRCHEQLEGATKMQRRLWRRLLRLQIGQYEGGTLPRTPYGAINVEYLRHSFVCIHFECSSRRRSTTVFTGLNVVRGTSTNTVDQSLIAPFHRPGSSKARSSLPPLLFVEIKPVR